LVYML